VQFFLQRKLHCAVVRRDIATVELLYNLRIMFRTFCLRSLPAWLLAMCIPVCQAQQAAVPLSTRAQQIQTKILALPIGNSLTVILKDKTEYHGDLLSADNAGFVLNEVDIKQQKTIRYEDVKKLRNGYGGMNHATGRHVDPVRSKVVVMAIAGGLIVILLAALATDK
jgi:hypothetical protein